MEINLRKARKLESKVNNLIMNHKSNLDITQKVRVNADIQSEILPTLVQARGEFITLFDNIQSLVDARFEIRKLISNQNEIGGVNASILEKVTLENKISNINLLVRSFAVLDKKRIRR